MKIALAQITPSLNKNNQNTHIKYINEAIGKADVIIFPELSLSGYRLMDGVFDMCYTAEELDIFAKLSEKITIILGAALREKGKIYNSALLFSEGHLLHTHHKNILPNYAMFEEARYYFKGENLDVFELYGMRCAVLICEDAWSSEVQYKLSAQNPDLIFVIANSPARGFEKELVIQTQWQSIVQSLAITNGAYVAFVNRVGFEDGMGFWGGSMLVSPEGKCVAEAELFKEAVLFCEVNYKISKFKKYLKRNG